MRSGSEQQQLSGVIVLDKPAKSNSIIHAFAGPSFMFTDSEPVTRPRTVATES